MAVKTPHILKQVGDEQRVNNIAVDKPDAGELIIAGRRIGLEQPPLVIAEIGINHEGDLDKAIAMIDAAAGVGCECVKFQSHVIEDEMIPNNVIPGNARESIWEIMRRCAFSESQERELKQYTEKRGMIFLSTPFSRAAAERLKRLEVAAYKIGSGECNNYPLVKHIASFGKPVILSTGMNDLDSIAKSVALLRDAQVPFALMHCTSIYPTPYQKVRLGALAELTAAFPGVVVGLSDHSLSNYPCYGAVALGARILERHFTADKTWPGPDIEISMDPQELKELLEGSQAIFAAAGGSKTILAEEQPTIDFAYASVVTIKEIQPGEVFSSENLWVKRPGTGEIKAVDYEKIIRKKARVAIPPHVQLKWDWVLSESPWKKLSLLPEPVPILAN